MQSAGRFDTVLAIDWSAAARPTRQGPNAIWVGEARAAGGEAEPRHFSTRVAAAGWLAGRLRAALASGERLLAGFDFAFGYPAGFATRLAGRPDAFDVWDFLARELADGPDNANNRFELADRINARFAPQGPFWGRPASRRLAHLPARKLADYGALGFAERRIAERRVPRAHPAWKLYTTGAVGSQMLTGLPRLAALRAAFGPRLSVWPFQPTAAPLVLAEIYPSLLDTAVRSAAGGDSVKDALQVRLAARALAGLAAEGALDALFALPEDLVGAELANVTREEGWILGAGHEAALLGALSRRSR
jgi:molybdopterin-guanine dinucleotide biosynthesis protein B